MNERTQQALVRFATVLVMACLPVLYDALTRPDPDWHKLVLALLAAVVAAAEKYLASSSVLLGQPARSEVPHS